MLKEKERIYLIIDASGFTFIDYTGVESLKNLSSDLRKHNIVAGLWYWMKLSYCNSLLVLRCITVLLAVLLARNYDIIHKMLRILFSAPVSSVKRENVVTTNRSWNDVNIFAPPRLNNRLAETLRLNELLARQQYRCENAMKVRDDKVHLSSNFSEALFISGSPDDYASLLITVMPERWTFFVPEGFQVLEKLGNVGENISFVLRWVKKSYRSTDEILYELANRRFDTAFISIYSPFVGGLSKKARIEELNGAPKLVERILKVFFQFFEC
ncbi:unnamed protein product [Gongylonema pulchrum]|uniref:STAS domain-containing protein n=1 Tax=Gongylonema pulchrum TaxID=637853 RepID=A0A183ED03_9BILA|nr:unnamed protein product [Gongylonema pulchrum]